MIESITLELRPRLRICNAFIHLQKKVNSTEVRIKLLEESIEVTIENNTIKFITKCIKLIPNSLSALNIINDWICFRLQTESNSMFGSFETEVLTNSTPKINSLKDSLENYYLKNTELLNASDCNILCAYCKTILSNKILIKRVLPIPDMNYDPSEWFCCKHNHDNILQNLMPLESDIFYGPLFFVIRTNLFNNNLKIDGNTIICNRCLQYLGKVDTNCSLKLWSCSIDYNFVSNSKTKNATDPFNDFLIAIKTSMTGIYGEEIILQSFVGKDIHCLILKPMDWHLNLMIEPKTISNNNTIILQTVSIVKVLYKYETSKSIINSTNKTYCEVGFLVIKAGLEHLLLSTKRFPQLHRAASDYYIGHIYLKKPINET
ncbi:E3 ubiquitin-protein ligase E3D [Ptiloglossa arizonensis]|uniref:E3 ubiquitin-protein ligase E3D n=1 Tax=Ptiloglossa arizonensis TaxID=3350558 RepID=UPI003F9ED817